MFVYYKAAVSPGKDVGAIQFAAVIIAGFPFGLGMVQWQTAINLN